MAGEIKIKDLNPHTSRLSDYESGILKAYHGLSEMYYGSMCPGWLESLRDDPEGLKEEYEKMRTILEPIISIYPAQKTIQGLMDILEDLRPLDEDVQPLDFESELDTSSRPSLDKYTIPLPFDSAEDEPE